MEEERERKIVVEKARTGNMETKEKKRKIAEEYEDKMINMGPKRAKRKGRKRRKKETKRAEDVRTEKEIGR